LFGFASSFADKPWAHILVRPPAAVPLAHVRAFADARGSASQARRLTRRFCVVRRIDPVR
jgi:hypothetical protein